MYRPGESVHPEPPGTKEYVRKSNIIFGSYLPEKVLTNQEIESWDVKTNNGRTLTAADISKKTGIERRYVATHDTAFTMGAAAAYEVIQKTGRDIDAVIVTTSFPQGIHFSTMLSQVLNIRSRYNLDVHAACSGFARTLAHIKEHEEKFDGRTVLVVATEKYSPYVYDLRRGGIGNDPSLAQTIFSDGAFAMAFEYGKGRDLYVSDFKNHRFPSEVAPFIELPVDNNLIRYPALVEPAYPSKTGMFAQNGPKVFESIQRDVPLIIQELAGRTDFDKREVKQAFVHQGSGRMVSGLADRLKGYQVHTDIKEGNFSSGSIPKTLMRAVNEGQIGKGDAVMMAGFGAGLFASAAVVQF